MNCFIETKGEKKKVDSHESTNIVKNYCFYLIEPLKSVSQFEVKKDQDHDKSAHCGEVSVRAKSRFNVRMARGMS